MIKAINRVNFGVNKKEMSDNRMPQKELRRRQVVKNLTLKAEEMDYFIKHQDSDCDYRNLETRVLDNLLTTLHHAEKSIIDILRKQDEHIKQKYNIQNNDEYICPIHKNIHKSLSVLDNIEKDEFDEMKL